MRAYGEAKFWLQSEFLNDAAWNYGACSATATSFVIAAIAINRASWKWLDFRGGVLLCEIRGFK
jgi:hypothetical protein